MGYMLIWTVLTLDVGYVIMLVICYISFSRRMTPCKKIFTSQVFLCSCLKKSSWKCLQKDSHPLMLKVLLNFISLKWFFPVHNPDFLKMAVVDITLK